MARSNRTEYAILGLLAREPMSGYDIRNVAEEQLGHFWHESFGHIYPVLKRLHERGWVDKRIEEGRGGPPRHEYSITDEGASALRDWFGEPIEPMPPRNELLLRVFLGRFADRDDLVARIREYRGVRASALARFEAIQDQIDRESTDHPDHTFWMLTLSAGVHAARSAVAWCDEALAELEATS
jgi:DNA-binding PadR family transcriptional regulator